MADEGLSFVKTVEATVIERFYGTSFIALAEEIKRLEWEAEIREKELDRLIQENKILRKFLPKDEYYSPL